MQQRRYVKGAPLDTVGELGYLPIGRWMTINLYSHGHSLSGATASMLPACGYHTVLDYFTVRPSNSVARGLVNLGSRNPHVHACVFNQLPTNEWVGPVNAGHLGATEAVLLGTRMTTACSNATHLSELANLMAGAQTNTAPALTALGSTGEFEREAIIRNAAQLYTQRQQLYTIIVRADAMDTEFGGTVQGSTYNNNNLRNGTVLGSAQAIFQVWRDPVGVDSSGHPVPPGNPAHVDVIHPCFVRLCKILSL